jgi:hypothetical protein
MNNLEITVTIIAIAVAQVLTILLTIGRERDIKELRELVNELREVVDGQRLRIVELTAWLAGRSAAQPSRIKSEREPTDPAKNVEALSPTPNDLPQSIQRPSIEDEAAKAMKTLSWSREIVAGLQAGLKARAPPDSAVTPKDPTDTKRPSTAEDEPRQANKTFKWFKEDADEAREIAQAREIVASLKGGALSEPATTPKDLSETTQSLTAEDEDGLIRATKAINWLKEDADKTHEIINAMQRPPPEKT